MRAAIEPNQRPRRDPPMWPLKPNDPLWESLRAIMRTTPRGLCTDIDGTISETAPTVDAAVITPDMHKTLVQLTNRFDIVATISGRAINDQRRLVNVPAIWHVGHHGYEWEEYNSATGDRTPLVWPDATPYLTEIARALDEIEAELAPSVSGLWMERKGITGGVHWRLAGDSDLAEQLCVPVIRRIAVAHGLRVRGGKFAMELLPPVITHKGVGLQQLVESHHLKAVLYFGDDMSDIDAFGTLGNLRREGRCIGLSIGVLHEESPQMLTTNADLLTNGITGVSGLMNWLAETSRSI